MKKLENSKIIYKIIKETQAETDILSIIKHSKDGPLYIMTL